MVWVALWVSYGVVVGWACSGTPIVGAVLLVVAVAAHGWLAMTLLRMGVHVYDDHLLIRSNVGRRINVAGSDIEGFELGAARDGGSSYRVVFARLHSGHHASGFRRRRGAFEGPAGRGPQRREL